MKPDSSSEDSSDKEAEEYEDRSAKFDAESDIESPPCGPELPESDQTPESDLYI